MQQQVADPSLWDDQAKGRRITSELARLNAALDRFDGVQRRFGDVVAIDELLADADDPELAKELAASVEALEADLDGVELEALLSGPYDAHDAIATVQAGAGGTESQDWAEMLLRMFSRWAERRAFDLEVDEVHYGEEAGIKSATFTVGGHNAYGLLSAERGVHRLVRISPFDAQKRRHTSFASLDVIPALDEAEAEELEIDESEL
ncbi:MAG: PCRF domain-containing protein, partial [Actinomycetota bacterium]|nr:PCRF domain-containing protein [Actinomycetota bacterium]